MRCANAPALCLNGGVCDVLADACVCPPGFARDFFVFHVDNCALPDSAPLWLLVQFIAFAIPTLVQLFRVMLFNSKVRVTGNAFRMLSAGFTGVLGSLGMFVGEYVQGGAYEVFCIAMFPTLIGPLVCLWILIHICLDALKRSMYMSEIRRLQKLVFASSCVTVLSFVFISIGLVIVVRSDNDTFNMVNSIAVVFQGAAAVFYGGIVYYVMSSLLRLLIEHKSSKADYFAQFARRVRLSRNLSTLFLLTFGITSLTMGSVQLMLGSMPYAWIIISLSIDSTLGILLAAIAFVERDTLSASKAMTSLVKRVRSSMRSLETASEGSPRPRHASSTISSPPGKFSFMRKTRSVDSAGAADSPVLSSAKRPLSAAKMSPAMVVTLALDD